MAKVLVATFTNMPGKILDGFRQGFVEALAREGNEVLVLRTNDFLHDYQTSNHLAETIDESALVARLREFAPELIVSMNHSGMFRNLAEQLDCPVGVWLLDGPSYLVEPDEVRRQRTRYHMFVPVRAFRDDLKDGFGFSNGNLHYLPFASDFQAQDLAPEQNISFVGTFFTGWRLQKAIEAHLGDFETMARIRSLVTSYAEDRDAPFSKRLAEFGLSRLFTDGWDEAYILNTLSINQRIRILDAVQDLGLVIYGTRDWPGVLPFSWGTALSYNPVPVTLKSELEAIYNASRINLNISHAQARGGLPWRVFDTMACNGAVISDYQDDLKLLFGADVNIPIYDSPSAARELCQQLLNDEARRSELVRASQIAINKGHRFKHRLNEMGEVLGLNLTVGREGNFAFLNADDFTTVNRSKADQETESIFECQTLLTDRLFSLQLFHSQSMAFSQENSQLAHLDLAGTDLLHHRFVLSNGSRYLRLDVGEYFSTHRDVSVRIEVDGQPAKFIDLERDVLASHQFQFDRDELHCGYDAYCVFENPFPNRNVSVSFDSRVRSEDLMHDA